MFGRTIAVLGGGFNHIYPKENEWLFHKILSNCGCIITEYAPNVEAIKSNFPKRNRIVSGLADVVLVVEAEYRSGTSITAKFAREQGKIVCCLPSNVDSRCGLGTNRLIKEGAKLIVKPVELEKIVLGNKGNYITENITPNMQKLPKEYEEIYKVMQNKTLHINDICRELNKDISQITPILTMMELEEYIEQLPGNQFKVKEE